MTTTHRPDPLLDHHDVAPPPPRAAARRARAVAAVAGGVGLATVVGVAVALATGAGSTSTLEQRQPASAPPTAVPVAAEPPAPTAAADLVEDGVDTVRIVGVADRDGEVVLTTDRIQLLSGDEADAYAAARGWEVPVPNDQLLVDDVARLRDYPVQPDAPVTLTIPLSQDPDGDPTATTLPGLRELLASRADGDAHPFELEVEDGVVVAVRMLYQP